MSNNVTSKTYGLPFRGLPAECRLIIWRFVLDEPARVTLDWPRGSGGPLWGLPISDVESDSDFINFVRNKMIMRTTVPNLFSMLLVTRTVNNEVRDISHNALFLDFHTTPTSLIRISLTCLSTSAWTMVGTIRMFIEQVDTMVIFTGSTRVRRPVSIEERDSDELWSRDGQQFEMLIKANIVPELILVASGDIWRAVALSDLETYYAVVEEEVLQDTNLLPLRLGTSSVLLQAVARGELQKLTIEINDFDEDQYKLTSEKGNGIFEFEERLSAGVEIVMKWDFDRGRHLWNGTCVVTRRV